MNLTDKLINLVKIDRKQFKKAFQENRSDPAKSLRMIGSDKIKSHYQRKRSFSKRNSSKDGALKKR